MDQIERDRLYLTWLSCKDFDSLRQKENQRRFRYVWRRIKTQVEPYFKNYTVSMDSIIKTFRSIHLTLDPRQLCGYDPQKDALIFNIWSLFFDPVNDYCIPTLPFSIGGQFVHEFDHYSYFKQNRMLGKSKEEYDEFDKMKLGQFEKNAFLSQIGFFKKCKENLPDNLHTYKISIMKWSKNGKSMEQKFQELALNKESSAEIIDSMIVELTQVIEKIDGGGEYNKMCTENTVPNMQRIANILSLPIELDPNKEEYPSVINEI